MSESSQSQPVLILGSVAAASVVLATGLPPLLPPGLAWVGPAVGLLGLTATAVLTVLTRAKVVPVENVAVRALPLGEEPAPQVLRLVAEEGLPGIPNGAPVDVTPSTPSDWAA